MQITGTSHEDLRTFRISHCDWSFLDRMNSLWLRAEVEENVENLNTTIEYYRS